METNFVTWLENEMKKAKMSRAELARQGGISATQVTRVLNGDQNPGSDFCAAVARALKIPEVNVYRAAGVIPPIAEEDELAAEILYWADEINDIENKKLVRDFAHMIFDRERSSKKVKSTT